MGSVWKVLTRKKILDPVSSEESRLGRILNTFDLTALGVGSTLGVGVYVLVGQVAKDIAGPSVVLSFLIATIASVFAGLCYAEFGARTPRAGSAYIYTYVCIGEFVAFIIGWNLILEYMIGSASVARGLSVYLDSLINGTLEKTFREIAPIDVAYMSTYFDFFAFAASILLAAALAFGLKESSVANNVFTLLNLGVVLFVIIAGSLKADTANWHLPANHSNSSPNDRGGFFPFGIEGMIKGAATCFYGFVGFDCIATTGEEVKNPRKAIPISIILSLFIIFLAYFGTSTVVTLMVPYYDQNTNAPLPYAFHSVGMDWAKWVVAVGGICALCTSLFGAMFPLPRIIYAMASDDIIFRFLGKVSERFKTPVVGTLLAGVLTGLMGALFDISQLISMMSIGTLLAYTIVAASVLLLRYEHDKSGVYQPLLQQDFPYTENTSINNENDENIELNDIIERNNSIWWKEIFNCCSPNNSPTPTTQRIVSIQVCIYSVLCIGIGLCAIYLKNDIVNGEIWAIILTAVVVALAVLALMSIASQPKSRKELTFKVPFIPIIPALSILINVYLMLMLDVTTWIRFAVWMAVGLPTYYFSVKKHPYARNNKESPQSNGKPSNGIAYNETTPKNAKIESAIIEEISELDDYLENIERNEFGLRQTSVDSHSNASNAYIEENIRADVHRSNSIVVPLTNSPPHVHVADNILIQSSQPVLKAPEDPPLIQETVSLKIVEETAASVLQEPAAPLEETKDDTPMSVLQESDEIKTESPLQESTIVEEENNEIPPPVLQEPVDETKEKQDEPVKDKADSILQNHQTLNVKLKPTKRKAPDIPTEEPTNIPPPPPPPLVIIEKKDVTTPKVDGKAFASVKLKHVNFNEPAEEVEENRRNSQENIKFGTEEFKKFKRRLDNNLRDSFIKHILPKTVKKDITPIAKPQDNENVIEETIDRDVAKENLSKFLQVMNKEQPPVSPVKKEWQPVELGDLQEDKENHRKHMENIFGTIKLRKVDSFKKDTDIPETKHKSDNSPDALQQHKVNMAHNFDSIKLRKVDSFKSD